MANAEAEQVALLMQAQDSTQRASMRRRGTAPGGTEEMDQLMSKARGGSGSGGRAEPVSVDEGSVRYIGRLIWGSYAVLLLLALSSSALWVMEAVKVETVRAWIVWGCGAVGGLVVAFVFAVIWPLLEQHNGIGTHTLLVRLRLTQPYVHAAVLASLHWFAISFLFQIVYGVLVVDLRSTLEDSARSLFDAEGGRNRALAEFVQASGPLMFSLHCAVLVHARSQWMQQHEQPSKNM